MTLTLEWLHRLERWRREVPKHFYCALGSVNMAGYITLEQLTPEQASAKVFTPMDQGETE